MENMKGKSILTSHLKISDEHYSSYSFSEKCEYCGDNADVVRVDEEGEWHNICMNCGIKHKLVNPSDEILEVIQDTMEDSVEEIANDPKTYDRRFICMTCGNPITKDIHIHFEFDDDLEDSLKDEDPDKNGNIVKFLDVSGASGAVLCGNCFHKRYKERD